MKSNLLKKTLTGFLATAMVLGLGTGAFANDGEAGAAAPTPAKVGITKTLKMAEGITTPAATFKFNIKNTDGQDTAWKDKTVEVAFTAADKATDGSVKKASADIFAGKTYAHAGEYKYEVSEEANTYTVHEGIDAMEYDSSKYTMIVHVRNDDNGGTYVAEVGMVTIPTNDEEKAEKVDGNEDAQDTTKTNFDLFENTYTKEAGKVIPDPENPDGPGTEDKNAKALTLSKTVTGDYADKTKEFSFEVTIKLPELDNKTQTYKVNVGTTEYTFTDGVATTVKLKDGQKLEFDSLPAGTRVTVKETGTADYTATSSTVANGVGPAVVPGTKGADLEVANALVGEKTNSIGYTNAFDDGSVTPTGIIINNLPFVMLLLVACVSAVAFFASKRRRA